MYNILINKNYDENITNIVVVQDGNVVEIYNENLDEERLEGNIYLGKVKNIMPGMQSAFIDLGEDKNALVHIKDLIPKASDVTGNVFEDTSKMDISKIVKSGDEILVQVKRDCNKQKGPRVTTDIKLYGRFIILLPCSKFITISQKIENKQEEKRLKEIVKNNLTEEYGAIIRTVAEGRHEQEIVDEINILINMWKSILANVENIKNKKIAPVQVFNNSGITGKIITDLAENNLEKIYTNEKTLKDKYIDLKDKIEIVDNPLEKFESQKHMNLNRKLWLKCGGFITIDCTEALTAIDVNSAKFTGKRDLEKTVLKVNMEATEEIAKQIRLRDIGGIIIIDYIDMENEEDREKVRNYIIECFKNDRSKVQVLEFTKLGLLEITRKHILGR